MDNDFDKIIEQNKRRIEALKHFSEKFCSDDECQDQMPPSKSDLDILPETFSDKQLLGDEESNKKKLNQNIII